jgi:hypothetical protein
LSSNDREDASYYLEIFLTSFAALLLEISYTRIVSFKVYYFFTYLIIGLALLGLGSGGVFVSISRRLREARLSRLLPWCCFIGGVVIGAGYFAVSEIRISTLRLYSQPMELFALTGLSLTLFAAYLCIGIVVSSLLARQSGRIRTLYFVDLLGAGLACFLVIPLMIAVTPPGVVFLAGVVLVLAGLRSSWRASKPLFAASLLAALGLAGGVAWPGYGVDPIVDRDKTLYPMQAAHQKSLFSGWSPVFRVDAVDLMGVRLLAHDGQAGSGIWKVDKDFSQFTEFNQDERAIPFSTLAPHPKVLIIGAAGGHEILASLFFGASSITGVELNPVTYKLLTQYYADYTNHMVERPEVRYINGEGRSFIARSKDRYDLIYYVAPDSYSAMNAATSGAFVMSESYLYTVEAIVDALGHLNDRGIVCMAFGEFSYDDLPHRTARYAATAREAFRRLGITDFEKHILIGTTASWLQLSTIVLRKEPFSPEEVAHFGETVRQTPGGRPRVYPGANPDASIVNRIVTLPDDRLAELLATYAYDVSPVMDNSPFFWHFARFRDLANSPLAVSTGQVTNYELAYGEQVLVALLALTIVMGISFLLLPFVFIRETWLALPYKTASFVYFGALGLGFMFIEIGLIQKLTLFLGYPTLSLTVTVVSMLVFAGLGSAMTGHYGQRWRATLGVAFAVLAVLTIAYQFALTPLVNALIVQPLSTRVMTTFVLIAPLGFCLGTFMPIGLTLFGATTPHSREYIAWCWAVNGFFSVVGSVLSTILAMGVGFSLLLFGALCVYAIGVSAIIRLKLAPVEAN